MIEKGSGYICVGVDILIESEERLILCVRGRRRGGARPVLTRGEKERGEGRE